MKNKKYILVVGDKDSYDRAISLEVIDIFDTLKEASDYLQQYVVYPDEKIKCSIKDKQTFVIVNYSNYYLNYTDGLLTYYSTGCPSDNEYCGETYEIFEIEV